MKKKKAFYLIFLHMPVLLYAKQDLLLKSHEYACSAPEESGRLLVGTCY